MGSLVECSNWECSAMVGLIEDQRSAPSFRRHETSRGSTCTGISLHPSEPCGHTHAQEIALISTSLKILVPISLLPIKTLFCSFDFQTRKLFLKSQCSTYVHTCIHTHTHASKSFSCSNMRLEWLKQSECDHHL